MKNLIIIIIMLGLVNYALFVENTTLIIVLTVLMISVTLVNLLTSYDRKSYRHLNLLFIILLIGATFLGVQANNEHYINQQYTNMKS